MYDWKLHWIAKMWRDNIADPKWHHPITWIPKKLCELWQEVLAKNGTIKLISFQMRDETHQDAMMALRDSSTSVAVSLCWGSSTRSFLIKHTVLSETRPSLRKWHRHKGTLAFPSAQFFFESSFKGIAHQKIKKIKFKPFQTRITYFLPWNTKDVLIRYK